MRTAIGSFGGDLKDASPSDLATHVVREGLMRANVDGASVGHVAFGHVINTEAKDMYLSRLASVNDGCSQKSVAFNVNRLLCGNGLQAIVSAA